MQFSTANRFQQHWSAVVLLLEVESMYPFIYKLEKRAMLSRTTLHLLYSVRPVRERLYEF